jgi:hypothetical protein
MTIILLALLAATAGPDGRHIELGDQCFSLGQQAPGGDIREFGSERQTVRVRRRGGLEVLEVVNVQKVGAPGAEKELVSTYTMRRADLRPISYVSKLDGVANVNVRYNHREITGFRLEGGASVPIRQPIIRPVWDATAWGLLIASLPLAADATFTLPGYHYKRGLVQLNIKVVGQEDAATEAGRKPAWIVEVSSDPAQKAHYLVARSDRRQLGYRAGGMRQSRRLCVNRP